MEIPETFTSLGVRVPDVYLPAPGVDLSRWAVVACDQYTSQPDYWERVEEIVDDLPSTYRLIFPEIYLGEGEGRVPYIHRAMAVYLTEGVLAPPRHGMILVARHTARGIRLGLLLAVDLEQYDFMPGADCAIRPTEGTILERLPPRMRVRQGGALELPHVMLLADDPEAALIAPLYEQRERLDPCYRVSLMQGGGELFGWWVPEADHPAIAEALWACKARGDGLLFAVGDGNHSLATARRCWLELREGLDTAARENHPARFALVEVVNLHDAALVFEPIHRILFGVQPAAVMAAWEKEAFAAGLAPHTRLEGPRGAGLVMRWAEGELPMAFEKTPKLPLEVLQRFLDGYLEEHPEASIDYIHGEAALWELSRKPGALGFQLDGMEKEDLFPHIARQGVLPRKAFSMGEAHEKRYYMEARKIIP